MSSDLILPVAIALVALAACLFALIRGGLPERLTAGLFLLSIPLALLLQKIPSDQKSMAQLGIDALFALISLALTLRYPIRWLGVVMLLYAAQFALHAAYMVADRPADALHQAANNLIFAGIVLCLTIGTLGAQARRRAAGPAEAA